MTKTMRLLAAAAIAGLASVTYMSTASAEDAAAAKFPDHDFDFSIGKYTDFFGYKKCEFKKDGDEHEAFKADLRKFGHVVVLKCEFYVPRTGWSDEDHKFPCFIKIFDHRKRFNDFTWISKWEDDGYGKAKLICIFKKHDDRDFRY